MRRHRRDILNAALSLHATLVKVASRNFDEKEVGEAFMLTYGECIASGFSEQSLVKMSNVRFFWRSLSTVVTALVLCQRLTRLRPTRQDSSMTLARLVCL